MATKAKKSGNYGKAFHVANGIIRKRNGKFVGEINRGYERKRKTFATKEEANDWIQSVAKQVEQHGQKRMRLTEGQLHDAISALDIAKPIMPNISLQKAVKFYLRHHKPAGGTRTVNELFNEYYERKKKENLSDAYLRDIRCRLGAFVSEFDGAGVHEITHKQIETWTDGFDHQLTAWNYQREIKTFFNFAVNLDLIDVNPARTFKKPKHINGGKPEFIHAGDVEKILDCAEEYNPIIAVSLALQFFAGIRAAEMHRLCWHHILLSDGIIEIDENTAKNHIWRDVTIEPNLRAWLEKYPGTDGKVALSLAQHMRYRRTICEELKYDWVKNGARHAFASYHFSKYRDRARTMDQMGHFEGSRIFEKHYKGRVSDPKDLELYWSIEPKL